MDTVLHICWVTVWLQLRGKLATFVCSDDYSVTHLCVVVVAVHVWLGHLGVAAHTCLIAAYHLVLCPFCLWEVVAPEISGSWIRRPHPLHKVTLCVAGFLHPSQ